MKKRVLSLMLATVMCMALAVRINIRREGEAEIAI